MPRQIALNSLIIKLVLSGIIVAVLASRLDLSMLGHLFEKIQLHIWIYAFALLFLQIACLSWRWEVLVNAGTRRLTYADSLRITLAGTLANFLFITSVGGIVARVALTVQYGVSLLKALVATAIDRLMTLGALVVIAAAFFPVLGYTLEAHVSYRARTFLVALVCGAIAFAGLIVFSTRKAFLLKNRKVACGYAYLRRLARSVPILCSLSASSLLAQLSYFLAAYLVAQSLSESVPLLTFMAVMPMIALIASLPVGYGSWGIREGAFMYGLGLIGIAPENAFVISVQIGLLSILTAVIAGVPALLSARTRLHFNGWKGRHAAKRIAQSSP